MATDPVRTIQGLEHETQLALDIPATLARLAALPPSPEAPYLTVGLDWRPEGTDPGRVPPPEPKRSQRRARRELPDNPGTPWRISWEEVGRRLDDLVVEFGPRGAAFDSLSADVERIKHYIDEELDDAAQGVIIVACHHHDLFQPVPLDIPVTTEIVTGPIPALRQLVHAAEDFPPYAVIVAEQHDAFLWLMEGQTWGSGVQFRANDYPRHTQQGGWSQTRYQRRAGERVDAFARTIAEETRQALGEGRRGIDYLIVAADEPMLTALNDAFHETVREKIIGQIHLAPDANVTQVAAEAAPLVEQAERQREMEAVQHVHDGTGAGTDGVAGAQATVTALQAGQVEELVMNADFSGPGWADFTLPLYGAGEVPREHPAGGDVANLTPVSLEDAVVFLALQTDAAIELVKSAVPITEAEIEEVPDADAPTPRAKAAKALDALGGIGAILRFSQAEQAERVEEASQGSAATSV
ncbi:MAG: hypothetical protein IT338_03210 [Thermomicrobiales bacterium]|nr:hypothetical protein [Thermomicrobiales bacterium]